MGSYFFLVYSIKQYYTALLVQFPRGREQKKGEKLLYILHNAKITQKIFQDNTLKPIQIS